MKKSENGNGNSRTMPHNLEAEKALLGSVLLDNQTLDSILCDVAPEDMYSGAHHLIFQRMVDLAELGRVIDLVTVSEELARDGMLEKAGGAAYVSSLTDGVPIGTGNALSEYVRIIKGKSVSRRLINAANNVIARTMEGADSIESLLDAAQSQFFDIGQEQAAVGFETPNQIFKDKLGSIETMLTPKPGVSCVLSGFEPVDAITAGWRPGELVIVAGLPGAGKTAWAMNVAVNIALNQKRAVGIESLEMRKQSLVVRMLCAEAKVDSWRVRRGTASQEDWGKLTNAMSKIFQAPLYIDDTRGQKMSQLRAKLRKLKADHNICLGIVDYLQLIGGDGRFENRTQEMSYVSRGLKNLAGELNIPILALCALNREVEKRGGKPRLSDLRECGSIEYDADIVQFLYRKKEDDKDRVPSAEPIAAYIAKQRDGPTDEVTLTFQKRWVRFVDWVDNADFGFDSKAVAAGNES